MIHSARMSYERRLVAAIPDPRVPGLAKEYVEALHPCYEWEGMSGCPAREAGFADEYINQHVDDPLVAYLPLLAAHRWLCAAEFFEFEKNPGRRAGRKASIRNPNRAGTQIEPPADSHGRGAARRAPKL